MTICFQKRKISHGHNLYYSSCSILVIKLTSALYKHRGLYRASKTKNFLQPAQRPIRVKKSHSRPIKPAQRPIWAKISPPSYKSRTAPDTGRKILPPPHKARTAPDTGQEKITPALYMHRGPYRASKTPFFSGRFAPHCPIASRIGPVGLLVARPVSYCGVPPPHRPSNYWAYVDMTGGKWGDDSVPCIF